VTSVLADVKEFVVPLDLVESTLKRLRAAGRGGYEAFVLWGGVLDTEDDTRFRMTDSYLPEQSTMVTENGLLVLVDGEALFRVNRAFHERGLILAAQVHSHPTSAYHSDTDDAFAMVTLIGGLSGVVPDFGDDGIERLADWAWYRLSGPGEWSELESSTSIRFEQ
jgi:hypothetical protein